MAISGPKLEVPTIYKAYFLGLCKGISPQNMVFLGFLRCLVPTISPSSVPPGGPLALIGHAVVRGKELAWHHGVRPGGPGLLLG